MGLIDGIEWARRNPERMRDDGEFDLWLETGSRLWLSTVANPALDGTPPDVAREKILSL